MNPRTAAWQFVCDALSPGADSVAVSRLHRDVQRVNSAWPAVVRLADSHRIACAVWVGVSRKGLSRELPDDARQYFAALFEMNAQRTAAIEQQIDECVRAFNDKGIVPLLLKGAAYLKAAIISDPAERIFSDVDVLVAETEIPVAMAALRSLGYREVPTDHTDYRVHRHCRAMFRPGAYGTIELHHRLVSSDLEDLLPVGAAVRSSVERAEDGLRYRYLSPTHMLAMSFLHSQLIDHYGETFTIGLRSVQDFIALSEAFPERIDWQQIDDDCVRHGVEGHFRNYIFAAERIARRPVTGIAATSRSWIHYAVAQARIRWQRVERLSLQEFTADYIRRKSGRQQNAASLARHRANLILNAVAQKLHKRSRSPHQSAIGT
jgi:hypothetical protein